MLRILLVLTLTTYIQCAGHYTIVGPKLIRPNSEYHVSVSLHDETAPCVIRISIQDEFYYKFSKDVTIAPYSTKIVKFATGEMFPESNYKLSAEGLTNIIFKNETVIIQYGKRLLVFMQTDKTIYNPADTIRFRVFVFDANMEPVTINGNMLIYILDGNSNRIKQWSNAATTKGVYSNELQLSDFPVLGDWSINAEVMGETKKKTIEVAEYVLPKFEVSIDAPAHLVYKDEKIRPSIRAKYTNGKPVKGEATITVQPKDLAHEKPLMTDLIIKKTVKIDGKANVEFDMTTDLKVIVGYYIDYEIEAVVEEELTGYKESAKVIVTIHQYKYVIKMMGNSNTYKPGLPFVNVIKIAHHNGTPVIDKVNKVKITYYGPNENDKNITGEEHSLDSNGMVTFKSKFPYNSVYVVVEYLGQLEWLGSLQKATNETGVYLQTKIITEVPTINKEISVEVLSTEKMSYFTYHILGHGDILASDTITVPDHTYHVFNFTATFSMFPKAQLIVYYVKDGKIVSEQQEFEFSDEFLNLAKPGKDLEVNVSTTPNTLAGLFGVDENVLSWDLDVFDELVQYSQIYHNPTWGLGGYDDFINAGAAILSNAKKL